MQIPRPLYLDKLIKRKDNGMAKVITGIRRCGKSYLLNALYREWLYAQGVSSSQIIDIALDDLRNAHLRDIDSMYDYITCLTGNQDQNSRALQTRYYVFLDEVQFIPNFHELINSLLHLENLDIYVTGSNSRFLSSDILTEFRGRGDEVRVRPLTFGEYHSASSSTPEEDWREYLMFGGMPQAALMSDSELKTQYLENLFRNVYLSDIEERNSIRHSQVMETLNEVLASSVGSFVSNKKIADTFKSNAAQNVTDKTIKRFIDFLEDAFIYEQAKRFDIKGRKYIGGNVKYYAEDIGLRNAILNFRQQEENHLMENVIYLELRTRGYSVDIGSIVVNEKVASKWTRKNCEVDFVATKGSEKIYIQSALTVADAEKRWQEERPFKAIDDSFEKILIVSDNVRPWKDENGVLTINVLDFLLGVVN